MLAPVNFRVLWWKNLEAGSVPLQPVFFLQMVNALGQAELPWRKNLYHWKISIPNGFFVQMVNVQGLSGISVVVYVC